MQNVLAWQSVTACDDQCACNGKKSHLCCAAYNFHVVDMLFIQWQHSEQETATDNTLWLFGLRCNFYKESSGRQQGADWDNLRSGWDYCVNYQDANR